MKTKRLLCLALVAVMLFTVGSVVLAAEISPPILAGSVTDFTLRGISDDYPNFVFIKNVTMRYQETLPLTVRWSAASGPYYLHMRISGVWENGLSYEREVIVYPNIAYSFYAPVEGTYTIELARPRANNITPEPFYLTGELYHPWQFTSVDPIKVDPGIPFPINPIPDHPLPVQPID